jgi:hypothetical protein
LNFCPKPSGRPASSVKAEAGKSTDVPVSGMLYFVHITGCAETTDVMAMAIATTCKVNFISAPLRKILIPF